MTPSELRAYKAEEPTTERWDKVVDHALAQAEEIENLESENKRVAEFFERECIRHDQCKAELSDAQATIRHQRREIEQWESWAKEVHRLAMNHKDQHYGPCPMMLPKMPGAKGGNDNDA